MDDARIEQLGCPQYRSRLEDCLADGSADMDADPELAGHLRDCAACREALEAAQLAGAIVRNACEPYDGMSGAFVTRVMAAIRDEDSRRAAVGTIWRPIELLASRFALVASVLLLAASVYLVEFAPPFEMPTGTSSQAEIAGLMPEPPAQPSNQDEVLLTLVEMENGY